MVSLLASRDLVLVGLGFALFGFTGCAHVVPAETQAPTASDSKAKLRRDNAALRRRVTMLEDRVLRVERELGDGGRSDTHDSGSPRPSQAPERFSRLPDGRELPVYKLEPDAPRPPRPPRRAVAPQPRPAQDPNDHRLHRPHTLTPAPVAEPELDGDSRWADPSGFAGQGEAVHAATSAQSFRLEGSRLVQLTQPEKARGPDKPARGRRGKNAQADYKAALALYRAAVYDEAESAFDTFAQRYPKSDFADNALYWKGEAAYDQGHYSDALASFTRVIERYAGGNKASDALLKIGLCYAKLGDKANAKDVLSKLVKAYPGARASDIARARLAEMGL